MKLTWTQRACRAFLFPLCALATASCGSESQTNPSELPEIETSQQIAAIKELSANDQKLLSMAGRDSACEKKVPLNLRVFFFDTFLNSRDVFSNASDETDIAKYSKVIAMSLKESSGASAAVTDMRGRGSRETLNYFFRVDNPGRASPSSLFSSTESANRLMRLQNVRWDHQTNFGLLQMSADRFTFSNEGTVLAHAFARRMQELYQHHPEEALDLCGTRKMFKNDERALRTAFAPLKNCSLGMSSLSEIRCFGNWAMLCPRYNVALALGAPSGYFATRKAAPLCATSLRNLLRASRR